MGQDTAQNESTGRQIIRSALAGAPAGPTGMLVGAAVAGGRALLDRFTGGRRRASEFAGTYGDRYAGTVPPINDRLPQPGMPGRPYGAMPVSGSKPGAGGPAYTVPTYGPQGDGQGPMAGPFTGAQSSGLATEKPGRPSKPKPTKPRGGSNRRASVGMGNQIWGAAQDSRALEDMAIHSRLIPTER